MKQRDCVHFKEITIARRFQTGESTFEKCLELIDEVCFLDLKSPKHHNEYDCKECRFYDKGETIK